MFGLAETDEEHDGVRDWDRDEQMGPVLSLLPLGWRADGVTSESHVHAGTFALAPDGQRYYVKARGRVAHVRAELLALRLYRAVGVAAATGMILELPDGRSAVATVAIAGRIPSQTECYDDAAWVAGFVADAWLGNHESVAVREDDDDVQWCMNAVRDQTGTIVRIDAGDAFGRVIRRMDPLDPDRDVLAAIAAFGDDAVQAAARAVGFDSAETAALVKYLGTRRVEITRRSYAAVNSARKDVTSQENRGDHA